MNGPDYEKIYDYFRNVQVTPSPQDLAPIEPIRRVRDTVTMGKPLEPWGPTRFHKTLALHIHRATRPASHSFRAANYGIMEDEESAKKWDFEA